MCHSEVRSAEESHLVRRNTRFFVRYARSEWHGNAPWETWDGSRIWAAEAGRGQASRSPASFTDPRSSHMRFTSPL